MILIDTNLLLYAVNKDTPLHQPARSWLEATLSSDASVGIPWLVAIAFLRITTSRRIWPEPMGVEQSLGFIDEWFAQPYVAPLNPGPNHWPILARLLLDSGTAGNLTNDAHIAAIAIEHGYTVYSSDNDFQRFVGLRCVNPLDGRSIQEQARHYVRAKMAFDR